jgi:phage minor structural protein
MNLKYPVLYDIDMKKLAILERAMKISYTQKYNGLWVAGFELPADDPKNALCQAMRYVEIFDSTRIDLFRITNKETRRTSSAITIAYQLEHVIITLIDSILYRYHQIGGLGIYTHDVLQYILGWQDTAHWQLGNVSFDRQFEYSWENENLLAAVMSVPKPIDEELRWTWNTVNYPWTLNLVPASNTRGPEVRAGRNMREMVFTEDPSHLTTRLYALGQGEGVNQLGIEDVNPTGEAYVDADTIPTYGVIARPWVDRRYEHAENLFEAAKKMLKQLKQPRIEVSVSAADLKNISGVEADRFIIGRPVTIVDADLGIDYDSRVVELSKSDVFGEPDRIDITIANQPQDIAGTIADLANRSRINEVYSQGATNIDSHQLADNCDSSNPMRIKFHIPTEAVFINKILLNYDISAFRAYSKGAASGGGSSQTSSSGGGSTVTSSSGGGSTQTSSSGGGQTSSSSGGHSHTVSGQTAQSSGAHVHLVYGRGAAVNSGSQIGSGTAHYHRVTLGDSSTHIGNATSGGNHTHNITGTTSSTISDHSHTVSNHNHSVTIPSHTHSVNVPSHSHSVTIPNHTHDIIYGIYSGPTPTAVTVAVDGNIVPDLDLNETEVSILAYLNRDAGGKITRGFHEVTITPNDLGRANVVIHIQQFIQSKGEVRI